MYRAESDIVLRRRDMKVEHTHIPIDGQTENEFEY